jgi:hypothetical protein
MQTLSQLVIPFSQYIWGINSTGMRRKISRKKLNFSDPAGPLVKIQSYAFHNVTEAWKKATSCWLPD